MRCFAIEKVSGTLSGSVRHINLDTFGVWEDNYDMFFEKRRKEISKRLRKWAPSRPIDGTGKKADEDDFDPEEIEEDSLIVAHV